MVDDLRREYYLLRWPPTAMLPFEDHDNHIKCGEEYAYYAITCIRIASHWYLPTANQFTT
jgi:hypothetical protein